MEQLLTISTVGFIISTIAAVAGVALSAITFWKFNIREVYLIRSGRGLKNALIGMEKQRAETGTLRDAPLDTDEKKESKKKAGSTDKAGMKAPETVPLRPAPETVPLRAAPETVQLRTAPETMPLDHQGYSPEIPEDAFEPAGERAEFDVISVEMETHTEEVLEPGSDTK
ncbi:MAG: hypothetical protein IKE74_10290 [Mogibacterium sp.]|nr:hypothetical protein [Mogibacterium sp.]